MFILIRTLTVLEIADFAALIALYPNSACTNLLKKYLYNTIFIWTELINLF